MKNVTFFILLGIFFFAGNLNAKNTADTNPQATTQWTGNVSSDWADSGNWSNGVPTMHKTAKIDYFPASNPDPIISSNTSFKKLQMKNFGRAYEVKVADGVTVSMTSISIASSGDPMDITFSIGNGTVTIQNEVYIGGQVSIENGSLNAEEGLRVNGYLNAQAGNIIVGTPTQPADFSVEGGAGTVNLNNSNLTVYGSGYFQHVYFSITSGTINISEDFDISGNFDFDLNQAILNIGGNTNVGNGSTLNTGTGSINAAGDFLLDGGGVFNLEQGNLTVSGDSRFASGGIFNGGSGNMELQGNTEFSGGQDFKPGTSTVTLNGNFDITNQSNNRLVTFYNLIVSETSNITADIDVIVNNYMYNYGNYQQSLKYNLDVIGELRGSDDITSPYPYLIALEVVDSHTLRAIFNQNLTAASAEKASNYSIRAGIESNSSILDPISANPVFEAGSQNVVIITTNNPIVEMESWVLWIKGYDSFYWANPNETNAVVNQLGYSVTDPFHKKRFVKDFVVWTGAVSSDWNNPGNWEYNGIGGYPSPGANFNLRYAASVTHELVLSSPVVVNNIDNSTFENMQLGGQTLTINGNITMSGDGKIVANEEGATILFQGNMEQLIPDGIFADNSVYNLTIDNSGAGVKLMGNLNMFGALNLTNGELNINNQVLTFKCTGEKSAVLAPVVTGSINGEVTVERCIPPLRAFRFISPSVTTSSSIHDNWQEGASSYTDNPNPGHGTHITGVGTSPDQTNGFDYTPSGNPSLYLFDNQTQTWNAIANTDVLPLVAGSSYRLMVRGDRSVDVTDNETEPSFTILRATGTLSLGNKIVPVNENPGAYNFVGNPYQAIVDMNDVLSSSTNLNPYYYYVWDPHTGTRGSYVTVDLAMGSSNVTGSEANQFLQPGQAFFVSTAAPGAASVLFEESDKAVEGDFTNVFKPEMNAASINMQLFDSQAFLAGGKVVDGFLVTFAEGESNEVLLNDASKLGNLDENLCSVNGSNYLSIEKRAMPLNEEIIPLFINQYRGNDYTLQVETAQFESNVIPYLHDAYLNTDTELPNGITLINFSIDSNIPASIAPDRFSITFNVSELSVDEQETDNLSIYPNPATEGFFYVSLPRNNGEKVEISLYNTLGQKVLFTKESISAANRLKIETGNLNAGVYLVEINCSGKSFTEKLIVK
ncbi:MAG TPA: T9SS type A sorting domain-containing protein [Flavobacteriaceae bacterium]|nr:T9SS type A sorting domain-containing protein [Flavobacteriaceae bacterium]